jgi:DNA-binding MarR family transcriptional regulator
MVKYEKFVEELINKGIDKIVVEKLIEEYRIVKREHLLGDEEKVILHSAKVSDLILALIKNKVSRKVVDINNIHFQKLLEVVRKYPKSSAEEVILTLAIPRVAESIYTIRSKKDVAHVKTIDPSSIDSSYCVSACDWMLSELVLLFFKADADEASELINSILEKKIPTVEEFEDGSIVILRKDLSVTQEIMLTLYHYYPKRLTNTDLIKNVKKTPSYVNKLLAKLENRKFIHQTEDGYKLTKLGTKYVEDEIITKKT